MHSILSKVYAAVGPNAPAAYGLAFLLVALALLTRFGLESVFPVLTQYVFITFFPAVLLAAVIGGWGPGLLALALSTAALSWFFLMQPRGNFFVADAGHIIALAVFVGFNLIIVAITATLRRTIVDLRSALDETSESRERLLAALDASGTGTWRWDIRTGVLEWDRALSAVYGLPHSSAPKAADGFFALVHPDDRAHVSQIVETALAGGGDPDYEFRAVLPDGSVRWIYDRSKVVRDAEGRPLYAIGACLDVTARKKIEEQQAVLVNELNHRVKNTLAVVQSLARLSLRGTSDIASFETRFMGRLSALSTAHDLLTATSWEKASLGHILLAELKPYLESRNAELDGPDVALSPRQAVAMALVSHELMTNAIKHGALSNPNGRVQVAWRIDGGNLHLVWTERGGPSVKMPTQHGFGSRLIEMTVAQDLSGQAKTDFASGGVVVTIEVPLHLPPA